MHLKNKAPADLTKADLAFLDIAPKTVLYAIAKHLAAQAEGDSYETALESGAYLKRMREEWATLHGNEIVPQSVPGKLNAYKRE